MKRNDYLLLGFLILTVLGFISQPVTAVNCEKNFIAHLDGEITEISTDAHAVIKLQFTKTGGEYSKLKYFINVANIEGVWEAYIYQKTNDKDWDPGNWKILAKLYEHNGGSDDVSGSLIKADNTHPDFELMDGVSSIAELQTTVRDFVTYAVITTSDYGDGEIASDFRCGNEAYLFIDKKTNDVDSESAPYLQIAYGEDVEWTYYVTNIGGKAIPDSKFEVFDDQIGYLEDPIEKGDPDSNIDEFETWVYNSSGTAECGLYENIATVSFDGTQSTDTSHYFGVCEDEAIITACKEQYPDTPKAGWKMILEGPDSFYEESYTEEVTGCVDFAVTQEGDYTLTEEDMPDWTRILPPLDQTGYEIDVAIPGTYGPYMFVNYEGTDPTFATINACKQAFPNSIVPDWMMYLDGPGAYDQINTTDETGCAVFSAVSPGKYNLSEEERNGWTRLQPTGENLYTFDVTGSEEYDFTFVNFVGTPEYATIPACKQDEKENPLGLWEMNLQGPGDYCLSQTTSEDGGCTEFSVPAITEDVTYSLSETQQPGWNLIYPSDQDYYEITVNENTITFDPSIFTNKQEIVTPTADLNISKTASVTTAKRNDEVTWTIIVTNNGPDDATNVTVVDDISGLIDGTIVSTTPDPTSGTIWNLGTLESGEEATITVVTKFSSLGDKTNNVTVYSDLSDPNTMDNSDTEKVTIVKPGPPPEGEADLSITKTASPRNPDSGEEVTYTIKVTNKGPDAAKNVVVTDRGMKWKIASLNNGESREYTVYETYSCYRISHSKHIVNIASVSADTYDPNKGNNKAREDISVKCDWNQADLSITKTASPSNPDSGEEVTYTIKVTNKGPDAAKNVVVTDRGMKWKIASLNNGESREYTVYKTYSCYRKSRSMRIVNRANVSADTYDPNKGNNKAHEDISVKCDWKPPGADLNITKDHSDGTFYPGDLVTWTVTVTNEGQRAPNTIVTEYLDADGTIVDVNVTQGTYDSTQNIWSVGELKNKDAAVLTLNTTFDSAGWKENKVGAASDRNDPNTENNEFTDSVYIKEVIDINVTKAVSTDKINWTNSITVLPENTVYWRINISNDGNVPFELYEGETWDELCDLNGYSGCDYLNLGSCKFPSTFQPGDKESCILGTTSKKGSYRNLFQAFGYYGDDEYDVAAAAAYYTSEPQANVIAEKLVSADNKQTWEKYVTVSTGSTIWWNITLNNTGNVPVNIDSAHEMCDIIDFNPENCLPSTACNIPKTLAPNQPYNCTFSETAKEGAYLNRIQGNWKYDDYINGFFQETAGYEGIIVGPAITIDKTTEWNGLKGDGLLIPIDEEITWNYTVTNTGNTKLKQVNITDDQLGEVKCTPAIGTLEPGESHTCTVSGIAVEGLYENTGNVTADAQQGGGIVTDEDTSSYTGIIPFIDIEVNKLVAASESGPWYSDTNIQVPGTAWWNITIKNNGTVGINLSIEDYLDDDPDKPFPLCEGFNDTLAPGENRTCINSTIAELGQHFNNVTVTASNENYEIDPDTESAKAYYTGKVTGPAMIVSKQIRKNMTGQELLDGWMDSLNPEVGTDIEWRVSVANFGSVPLTITNWTDNYNGTSLDLETECTEGFLVNLTDETFNTISGLPDTLDTDYAYVCIIPDTVQKGLFVNTVEVEAEIAGDEINDTYQASYLGTITSPAMFVSKQIRKNITGQGLLDGWMEVLYSDIGTDITDIEWRVNVANLGSVPLTFTNWTDNCNGEELDLETECTEGFLFNLTDQTFNTISGLPETLATDYAYICIIPDTVQGGHSVNNVTVEAEYKGEEVNGTGQAQYFKGPLEEARLTIDKTTEWNGQSGDALLIPVGETISWNYTVTNTGNKNLNQIEVTDNHTELSINCPQNMVLKPGESLSCNATGTAVLGPYANIGNVTAHPAGKPDPFRIGAEDESSYTGVSPHATVKGTVFNDTNVNGTWEAGETGVADANITISNSTWSDYMITGPDGNFTLTVPAVGDYVITETNPAGYVSTNAIPGDNATKWDNDNLNITITALEQYSGHLFGDVQQGSVAVIMGGAFNDTNENGTWDAGENGLPGVNVTMEIESNPANITVKTNSSGNYQFAVAPGINVKISSEGPGGDYYPTSPEALYLTPPSAGEYPDNNFGYSNDTNVAVIYGIVFNDTNENRTQDFGESGLVGANVTLDDTTSIITSTNGLISGTFNFVTDTEEIHTLQEDNPTGYRSTTDDDVNVEVTFGNSFRIDFGDVLGTPSELKIDVEKYVSNSQTGPWYDADTLTDFVPIRTDIYDDVWWNITVTNNGTIWVDLNVTDLIDHNDSKPFPICEGFTEPLAPGMSRTCINNTTIEDLFHHNNITLTATNESYPEMSYTDTDLAWYFGGNSTIVFYKLALYDLPGLNYEEKFLAPVWSYQFNKLLFPDLKNMIIPAETPLNWTYWVINMGTLPLEDVVITDDKLGTICEADGLEPIPNPDIDAEFLICHRSGTVAQLGENITNVGTLSGNIGLDKFKTTSEFTYTGVPPLVISKMVWGIEDLSFDLLFQNTPYLEEISLPWLVFVMDNYMFMDDEPRGLTIPIDVNVNWTYAVMNIGFTPLSDVKIEDDKLGMICEADTLAPAMSTFGEIESQWDPFKYDGLICYANDTSIEGQYENNGTVTAKNTTGYEYTAYDLSHYYGSNELPDFIEVEKTVSDNPDGPWVEDISVPVGSEVWWNVTIRNNGIIPYNLTLEDYLDDDVDKPVTFTQWPDEPVLFTMNENYTLISSTLAEKGEHFNNVTVHAELPLPDDIDPEIKEFYELFYRIVLEGSVSDRANYTGTSNDARIIACKSKPSDIDIDTDEYISNPLSGWQMNIYREKDGAYQKGITNETGCVAFTVETGATYKLFETQKKDWRKIFPVDEAVDPKVAHYEVKVTEPGDYIYHFENMEVPEPYAYVNACKTDAAGKPLIGWAMQLSDDSTGGVNYQSGMTDDTGCTVFTLEYSNQVINANLHEVSKPGWVNYTSLDYTFTIESPGTYDHTFVNLIEGPAIDIEKLTNGYDADEAPGPSIRKGSKVEWSYVVTNLGSVGLYDIKITDDKRGEIKSIDTLKPGQSVTVYDKDKAKVGQYSNVGNVTAFYKDMEPNMVSQANMVSMGRMVSDEDVSHYKGIRKSNPGPNPEPPDLGAEMEKECDFYENGTLTISNESEVLKTVTICAWDGIGKLIVYEDATARDPNGEPLEWATIVRMYEMGIPHEGLNFTGYGYELGPFNATFDPAVTLMMEFTPELWPELEGRDLLLMFRNNETGTWDEVATTIGSEDLFIKGDVTTQGIYGLFEEEPPVLSAELEEPTPPLQTNDWIYYLIILLCCLITASLAYWESRETD